MAEFVYNNAKNASSGYMFFKLNYGYYLQMSYKDDIDPRSKFKSADKLSTELRELMIVCKKNLYHAQELHKRAYNKDIKLKSYIFNNKV